MKYKAKICLFAVLLERLIANAIFGYNARRLKPKKSNPKLVNISQTKAGLPIPATPQLSNSEQMVLISLQGLHQ